MTKTKKEKEASVTQKNEPEQRRQLPHFPQNIIGPLAEEIARTVVQRLPNMLPHPRRQKSVKKDNPKMENAIFLDTSAIIDGRIFDVIDIGLLTNTFVVPESILSELKHIADSQDTVKRERGRKGLDRLNELKKKKGVKVVIMREEEKIPDKVKSLEIDERLLKIAKNNKGKLITCDYNLEKKASIQGVQAVNVNQLANILKITAVPGESLHIQLQHIGKDPTQGVGYLDDGTMVVAERSAHDIGKTIDVVISRVIQTSSGRILFAKQI